MGDVGFCPMVSKNMLSCKDNDNIIFQVNSAERFGADSHCFETVENQALCLKSFCSIDDGTLIVYINNVLYICEYDGQILDINIAGFDFQVTCPRIAAVCPDLICPSSCSGKGICDYCMKKPQCICDNPLDTSEGCWGELVE